MASEFSQFCVALEKYLDGVASVQDVAIIKEQLENSSEMRDLFVATVCRDEFLHRQLCVPAAETQDSDFAIDLADSDSDSDSDAVSREIMSSIVDQALELRRVHELEDHANVLLAAQRAEDHRESRYRRRDAESEAGRPARVIVIPKSLVWLSMAALVGIIIWVGAVSGPAGNKSHIATTPPPSETTRSAQPRIDEAAPVLVAVLSDARAMAWGQTTRGQQTPGIGSRLEAGAYFLEAGIIEITFDQGTVAVVEGPARFELLDGNAGFLELGTLTASVPPQAHGFTVTTPAATLVDLGTEFGVRVDSDGVTQSHVFLGEITAAPATGPRAGLAVLVSEQEGAKIVDEQVEPWQEPAGYVRRVDDDLYRVELTGDAEQIFYLPASLGYNAYERDHMLRVFSESRSVLIDPGTRLLATLSGPGSAQPPLRSHELSLDGIAVDSYLLHFDVASVLPVGTEQTIAGSITFPRPVLAVQCGLDDLLAGDPLFAVEGCELAAEESNRAIYSDTERAVGDWFRLSQDRRTLRFQIKANNLDQFRVLIEAARPRETDR